MRRCPPACAHQFLPGTEALAIARAGIPCAPQGREGKVRRTSSEHTARAGGVSPQHGETIIADRFEAVSILFADIVGFTPAAAAMTPASLVASLNRVFSEFDSLALRLGVEKIKTIGDAYMAAAGLPEPRLDHAEAIAAFAIGILDLLGGMYAPGEPTLHVRIGIYTGPVVAGVIGRHKFSYDVWGDTVNVASRLEAHGVADRIQVSQEVREVLAHRFEFEERGPIMLKGKGMTPTFFLVPH